MVNGGENALGNESDNALGNDGDNSLGNEGDNIDIHVDAIPSHHQMIGPIRLTLKGSNTYKMDIKTNIFGQPIGNNVKHVSSFSGAIMRELVPITYRDCK